jgi:hypothetical protein
VTAEPVAFLERSPRALVLVDLVAGHDHDALEMLERPAGLEQRSRAEHVGGERRERVRVGFAHQRLRGQVKDDLRIRRLDRRAQPRRIANVRDDRGLLGMRVGTHDLPEARHGGRRERVAGEPRAQARSQSHSHAPLNPVCPVTRTRRPCQKSRADGSGVLTRKALRLQRALDCQ